MRRLLLLILPLTQAALGVEGQFLSPSAPPGLAVQLRTVGDKTTFYLSEVVPLEVVFRASTPSTYSIEIGDGWNAAPAADRFLVSPAHDIVDRNTIPRGLLCCDSRRVFLTSTPAVYAHELTDHLRFVQPGEYRVQYQARRVFAAPPVRESKPSELLVRSNVITIRIVEDDPSWLAETLDSALEVVDTPPPMSELLAKPLPLRGSLHAPVQSETLTRYRRAARQLRMLDTPDAIRARVARIQMPSVEQWRDFEADQTGYHGVDTSVVQTSRPDLVAAALRERAAEPGFGVMRGYFELWVTVILERDHPELFRLPPSDESRMRLRDNRIWERAHRATIDSVRELNASKTGLAAEITDATLRWVERELDRR